MRCVKAESCVQARICAPVVDMKMHAWLFGDILLIVTSDLMLLSKCILFGKVAKESCSNQLFIRIAETEQLVT